MNRAAVYDRIMTNRYIIANLGRTFLVGSMNYRPVLYVDSIPNTNAMDITTHHSLIPHRAVIAYNNVSYKGGVFGKKTIGAIGWGLFSNRFNKHI